jgi:hypothetical protein
MSECLDPVTVNSIVPKRRHHVQTTKELSIWQRGIAFITGCEDKPNITKMPHREKRKRRHKTRTVVEDQKQPAAEVAKCVSEEITLIPTKRGEDVKVEKLSDLMNQERKILLEISNRIPETNVNRTPETTESRMIHDSKLDDQIQKPQALSKDSLKVKDIEDDEQSDKANIILNNSVQTSETLGNLLSNWIPESDDSGWEEGQDEEGVVKSGDALAESFNSNKATLDSKSYFTGEDLQEFNGTKFILEQTSISSASSESESNKLQPPFASFAPHPMRSCDSDSDSSLESNEKSIDASISRSKPFQDSMTYFYSSELQHRLSHMTFHKSQNDFEPDYDIDIPAGFIGLVDNKGFDLPVSGPSSSDGSSRQFEKSTTKPIARQVLRFFSKEQLINTKNSSDSSTTCSNSSNSDSDSESERTSRSENQSTTLLESVPQTAGSEMELRIIEKRVADEIQAWRMSLKPEAKNIFLQKLREVDNIVTSSELPSFEVKLNQKAPEPKISQENFQVETFKICNWKPFLSCPHFAHVKRSKLCRSLGKFIRCELPREISRTLHSFSQSISRFGPFLRRYPVIAQQPQIDSKFCEIFGIARNSYAKNSFLFGFQQSSLVSWFEHEVYCCAPPYRDVAQGWHDMSRRRVQICLFLLFPKLLLNGI